MLVLQYHWNLWSLTISLRSTLFRSVHALVPSTPFIVFVIDNYVESKHVLVVVHLDGPMDNRRKCVQSPFVPSFQCPPPFPASLWCTGVSFSDIVIGNFWIPRETSVQTSWFFVNAISFWVFFYGTWASFSFWIAPSFLVIVGYGQ